MMFFKLPKNSIVSQNNGETQNNAKKNNLRKDLADNANNDKRKGDRNYSDLFGRETLASPKLT